MMTPSPNGARWPEPQPLANPGRFSSSGSNTSPHYSTDSSARPDSSSNQARHDQPGPWPFNLCSSGWCPPNPLPGPRGARGDHQDRQRHARRLLIEAAWHHRPRCRPGAELRRQEDTAPPAARDRGERANRRLHARWQAFDTRHKRAVVANSAITRELAGWCWSLAVLD